MHTYACTNAYTKAHANTHVRTHIHVHTLKDFYGYAYCILIYISCMSRTK